MSIVRISHDKENPYTLMNKTALEDTLSWGAKGLWAYLISRPDNWNVSVVMLVKMYQQEEKKGGGERAIYSLLKELIENGYCIRVQHKTSKGLFTSYEYVILEHRKLKETITNCSISDTEKLKIELPHRCQRDVDNRDLNNNDINNIVVEGENPIPEESHERPLNEAEQKGYETLCNDSRYDFLPDCVKSEAIQKFGWNIVGSALNYLFDSNPCLDRGKTPKKAESMTAIFLAECIKRKKKNGKK